MSSVSLNRVRFNRYFTAAELTASNEILGLGQPVVESDTGFFKIGDGIRSWNDLPYAGSGTPSSPTNLASITFIIDGGGATITTGIKGDLEIPFACTINRVTLLADQSGSIVIDIWKDTYGNFPPVAGDSITASAKPAISSATKSQDSTLTGWVTSISAGNTLRFNVDSITSLQRVTLSLKITK